MKVRRLNSPSWRRASRSRPYYGGHSPEIAAGYFAHARNGRIVAAREPKAEALFGRAMIAD
jgi:hypothetical protein